VRAAVIRASLLRRRRATYGDRCWHKHPERAWCAASRSRDASWRTLEGDSGFGLARCSRDTAHDQRHVART
jgi:hypothetical protein